MAKKTGDSYNPQDVVEALKTELFAAFDRVADKLEEGGGSSDSGSTTSGQGKSEGGAMQLFKLDGRTQLVAQFDESLPSGEYKVVVSINPVGESALKGCTLKAPCCDSLNCTVLG